MTTVNQFLTMGGYGQYLWPAYGMVLLVMGINIVLAIKKGRQIKKRLMMRYEQEK